MRTFKDALKTLAVFFGIGPLVGLVIFATGSSLLALFSGTKDGFWIGPFMLVYGLIFAHFVGGVWAAIAGAVTIAASYLLKRTSAWIGPASGALTFAISTLTRTGLMDGPILSADGTNPGAFWLGYFLLLAATHIGAAWVSWVVAKRWIG